MAKQMPIVRFFLKVRFSSLCATVELIKVCLFKGIQGDNQWMRSKQ